MDKILAAVDIGGTKITVSLTSKEKILIKVYQLTEKKGENTAVPVQIDNLISHCCDSINIKKEEISAIGVSACGPFQKKNGIYVLKAANICGGNAPKRDITPNNWTEIPLESELYRLNEHLNGNGIILANDAISAAMAERNYGSARGIDNFVYVTWSTGIGAGAYVDGKLITGKNGNAMHMGHTFISYGIENDPVCGCGDYGHIESFSAGPAIARDYGAPTKEVFDKYHEGNKEAKNVIKKAAKIFARGLVNITAILDTELIILGGSVCNNWDILEDLVKYEYYNSFKPLTEGVEFKLSGLQEYLGDLAALSLVMPFDWIDRWFEKRIWEKTPETVKL